MNEEVAAVSAIIPCYRCTDTIGLAVESIYAQTMKPIEVLLVDDCSNDGTLGELYNLQSTYPAGWIKVISLIANDGPGTARNAGWEAATQPFLAFLDADDSWHHQKIEIQFKLMLMHPEVMLTGHKSLRINRDMAVPLEHYDTILCPKYEKVTKWKLLTRNRFTTSSIMLNAEIKYRFLNGKRRSEDYLLWIQIINFESIGYVIDLPLIFSYKAKYGEAGLSKNLWLMQTGQVDTYKQIYKKKYIGNITYIGLICYSWARFVRRVVMVVKLKMMNNFR